MSALARIVLSRGFPVSGSDHQSSAITESLTKEGAYISIGYTAENLPEGAIVVYSTAVLNNNPELLAAKERGFTIIHRSELLRRLIQGKKGLLVAGTHGKTTTSSLLTHVLHECGMAPSYAIGGMIHSLGNNGGEGFGDYFIAEACESDGTFLDYPGFGGIITNIDKDHLDYWKTEEALVQGFRTFIEGITSKQHILFCADDERLSRMSPQGISYGFSRRAMARISQYSQQGWTLFFDLEFQGRTFKDIEVTLIGRHNVLNSSAVFVLGLQLGISETSLRSALKSFCGVGRRVEKRGDAGGVTIFDDYGHHPAEIVTTLEAIKTAIGKRRLIAVFQPHRYTRTRDCLEGFSEAFVHADLMCLTDIYSAGELPISGINVETLLETIRLKQRGEVLYMPRKNISIQIRGILKQGDVVVTIGAGDITKVGAELLEQLQETIATVS